MIKGDRFQSIRQLARIHGVSTSTAMQAVTILVDRNVLTCRDRSGTFIGDRLEREQSMGLTVIQVVFASHGMIESFLPVAPLFSGLRSTGARVSVQFTVLPDEQPLEFLESLLDDGHGNARLGGVVPVSCHREIYARIDDLGLPAVAIGTPDSDLALPSIDIDNHASGKQLAAHLARAGHQRIALLSGGEGRPGDHAFLDGVFDAMSEAGCSPNALIVRNCSYDLSLLETQLDAMFHDRRPTGVICRYENMLPTVEKVARSHGVEVGRDIEIVSERTSPTVSAPPRHTHVRPEMSFEEIGRQVGEKLAMLRRGDSVTPQRHFVPVVLEPIKP